MFSEKSIIHISQFDFKNKQPLKGRYFIIMCNNGDNLVVMSAATKTKHLSDIETKAGCIKHVISNFHCYHFPKKKIIGAENNFSFKKDTFIYVNKNIQEKEITWLNSEYVERSLVEKIDILNSQEYEDLLYCIYTGDHVKRKIKRAIEPILEKICK